MAPRRWIGPRHHLVAAGALLTAMLLAACGGDRGGSGGSDGLEGRAFLSEAVVGHSVVDGTRIRLAFDGAEISAQAGCNTIGGRYEIIDGRLVLRGAGLSMTEMACDPDRHAQDEWLAGFLDSEPLVELGGDTLTLTTAAASVRLLDRLVADPDRPLVGTRWRVDTVLWEGAAMSVPEATPVILQFQADGSLVASSVDCTSVRLDFDVDRATLRFGEFVADTIGCPLPWEPTVEVLRAGEAAHSISAARLTITTGDLGIGAVAD